MESFPWQQGCVKYAGRCFFELQRINPLIPVADLGKKLMFLTIQASN